jgi:hypothetical protein
MNQTSNLSEGSLDNTSNVQREKSASQPMIPVDCLKRKQLKGRHFQDFVFTSHPHHHPFPLSFVIIKRGDSIHSGRIRRFILLSSKLKSHEQNYSISKRINSFDCFFKYSNYLIVFIRSCSPLVECVHCKDMRVELEASMRRVKSSYKLLQPVAGRSILGTVIVSHTAISKS